ncbi:hypothetical protein C0389_01195 [bacterium]|nr:hypothetical protein [bacterium]
MNTIYNEKENKHAEMIKDLHNLPKIESPENFEYKLMTRINNKNFGSIEKNKPVFNWVKFLAPSAFVVTAIILLFVFFPSSRQIENPLLHQSQKSDSQSIVNNSLAAGEEFINSQESRQNTNPKVSDKSVNPGSPVRSVSPQIPFNTSRSVSLDDYISGGNNPRNLQQGNIVNSGSQTTPLDQFFVAENPDPNMLKKMRAKVDSLKKAQLKADSLKKVQKSP